MITNTETDLETNGYECTPEEYKPSIFEEIALWLIGLFLTYHLVKFALVLWNM